MANNKVQLADGTTIIDLTGDTVTPQTMVRGTTAHDRSGASVTGVVDLANAGTATPLSDNANGAVGTSTSYSREDHVHPISGDVFNDVKTSISADPASLDAIKSYDVGIYRVAISNSSVFPTGYGILEILKGSSYSMARFSNMNSSVPMVWRVQWNTSTGDWYQNGVWLDEQKYVKELLDQLPVANGGTGATTASGARTNLGLGSVAVENTVPIAKGGTGATDAANARTNLGLGTVAVESTVPVAKGGTGATTAANARKNLELCYAANDTESSNSSNPVHGVIQSSGGVVKSVYLEFIVAKSIENISTITVTALNGRIYGINGEIDNLTANTNYTSGNYTATASKLSNTRIRILIAKSSAFANATVNTPVVYWGTIGLKFT